MTKMSVFTSNSIKIAYSNENFENTICISKGITRHKALNKEIPCMKITI